MRPQETKMDHPWFAPELLVLLSSAPQPSGVLVACPIELSLFLGTQTVMPLKLTISNNKIIFESFFFFFL